MVLGETASSLFGMAHLVPLIAWAVLVTAIAIAFIAIGIGRRARAPDPRAVAALAEGALALTDGPATARLSLWRRLASRPGDRILPFGARGFALLVVLVAAGSWLAGFALAPSAQAFLASPEWRFQPFYVAAHLVTLRAFVAVFTKNFRIGIAHLDVAPGTATSGFRFVLGPAGALLALLIALPFCALDYRALMAGRTARLGLGGSVGAIDLVMWGIWCAEWFLNAFIWIVLVGFLFMNLRTIRRYRFRDPVEQVMHERQYRPFLNMSAQGATIVLAFSVVTVLYIVLTGGELTDYLGLAATAVLLVIGFLVPWLALRSKVRGAVEEQKGALASALAVRSAKGDPAYDLPTLGQRLDDVVAVLRLNHLESMHVNLGRREARAILVRLVAPAVTIGWHYAQRLPAVAQGAEQAIQGLIGRLVQ